MLQLKVATQITPVALMAFVSAVATPIVGPVGWQGFVWMVDGEISKKGLGDVGVIRNTLF